VLSQAEAHRCDLIAIATRGLGGVQRMFLGSVADKVIRGAAVPVLVVNPPAGALHSWAQLAQTAEHVLSSVPSLS
jgi:hypothetical protein